MTPPATLLLSALPPRDPGGRDLPARYALVLRPEQSAREVAAQVRAELAEFDPQVTPISPTDHGALVLELPTRTLQDAAFPAAFAAGYALADEFRLRTAEPDLPTPFFPRRTPPTPGGDPFPPGCWADHDEPGGLPAAVLERAVLGGGGRRHRSRGGGGNCVRTVVWPARTRSASPSPARTPPTACGAAPAGAPRSTSPRRGRRSQGRGRERHGGRAGQGTSYAVALIAGVAALWLAHHGRADLLAAARARGETLQDMFLRLLQATARRPAGWDSGEMGAGIADARALLAADLDAGRARRGAPPLGPAGEPGSTVTALVAETAGAEAADDTDLDWVRYGPELAAALLEQQLAAPGRGVAAGESGPAVPVSGELARAVRNVRLRDHLGLDDGAGLGSRRPPSEAGRTEPQAWPSIATPHRPWARFDDLPAGRAIGFPTVRETLRARTASTPLRVPIPPMVTVVDDQAGHELVRQRDRGSRIDTVRARRVPARTREWSQVVG